MVRYIVEERRAVYVTVPLVAAVLSVVVICVSVERGRVSPVIEVETQSRGSCPQPASASLPTEASASLPTEGGERTLADEVVAITVQSEDGTAIQGAQVVDAGARPVGVLPSSSSGEIWLRPSAVDSESLSVTATGYETVALTT